MNEYRDRDEYKIIRSDRERFLILIDKFNNISDQSEKLKYAKYLTEVLVTESLGYFFSYEIEKFYLSLAENNDIDSYNVLPKKNSVLHVASKVFDYGGHTRVIERWIELSPSDQVHSFVLTNFHNDNYITPRIIELCKINKGCIYLLDRGLSLIDKALKLRKIALKYEKVVLHIHNEDPIALIAFGNKKFTRPIVFYNHSDHLFWLGVSISDFVAEFRSIGMSISRRRRNVKNNMIIGIPLDFYCKTKLKLNKINLCKKFNLPTDKTIILTGGSLKKLQPYQKWNYVDIVLPVLKQFHNCIIVVVGNTPNHKLWRKPGIQYGDRLKIFPLVNNEVFNEFVFISDIVIDSMPMGGGVALIDAIMYDKPVLSLENPLGQLDYIYNSLSYCKDAQEFQEKLSQLIQNKMQRKAFILSAKKQLIKFHSTTKWNENVKSLFNKLPAVHNIRSHLSYYNYEITREDLASWIYCRKFNVRNKVVKYFGIKNILESYKVEEMFCIKIKYIKLFSIIIFKKEFSSFKTSIYFCGLRIYNKIKK